MRFLALILLLTQSQQPVPSATDRLIGLLELPEVFSTEPCEPFDALPLTLRSEPSDVAQPLGTVEVANPWKAGDGCPALNVRFMRNGRAERFPAQEVDYEQQAAVVLQRAGQWFRIRLEYGSGWLYRESEAFHSYPDLLQEELTFIPQNWDNKLFETPARSSAVKEIPAGWRPFTVDNVPVTVLGTDNIEGELWFHVRFDPESGCGTVPSSLPVLDGFIPGYRDSGEPGVWFYSRGC